MKSPAHLAMRSIFWLFTLLTTATATAIAGPWDMAELSVPPAAEWGKKEGSPGKSGMMARLSAGSPRASSPTSDNRKAKAPFLP